MNVFQASFHVLDGNFFLIAQFIREHCKGLSRSNQIDLGLKTYIECYLVSVSYCWIVYLESFPGDYSDFKLEDILSSW